MSGYGGANAKMSDVLRSVLLLTAGVLVLFVLGRIFFTVEPDRPVSEVDYITAAEGVEPTAGFDPWVPERLPEGWMANSARIDATTWEMGVVTDDDEFIGIRQLHDGEGEAIDRAIDGDAREETVNGVVWQVGESGEELVYATTEDEVTTVVRSTTSAEVTRDYVSSLVPFSELASADASR